MRTEQEDNIEQIATRCVKALQHRPCGVFSDFDGTLSEVAPTPDAATPYAGASEAMARIANVADAAGIITGRAVADVRNKIGVESLTVVGNHGLEWFENGQHIDHEAGTAAVLGIEETLAATRRRLEDLIDVTGMLWENKRLTASVHYRNAVDPVEVGMQLLPIIEEEATARNLRVSSGKMLVELRPLATVSKGTALEQLILTHGLRSAVFLGDDVTDVDGFRSLHRLREEQGIETLAIAIRSEDVHPEVIAESDVVLEGVEDSVTLLNRIADALGR